MARIAGVELQDKWKVDYALTNIKGIGWALSKKVLMKAKIDPQKRVSDLTSADIAKISSKLEEHPTGGDVIRQVKGSISRLQTIGSYRGARHARGLPVRGQCTQSNARTRKGPRKTVAGKKGVKEKR